MTWYEIIPRLNVDYGKLDVRQILGNKFAVLFARQGEYIHWFLRTLMNKQALTPYFVVRDNPQLPGFDYYVVFRTAEGVFKKVTHPKTNQQIEITITDVHSIIDALLDGQALFVYANYDKRWDMFYVVPALLGKDRSIVSLAKQFRQYFDVHVSYIGNVGFIDYVFDFNFIPLLRRYRVQKLLNAEHKIPAMYELYEKNWILMSDKNLSVAIIADPVKANLQFSRALALPTPVITDKPGSFRVGVLESGQEFRLSPEDFFRHGYIIGSTGSGKSNLMAILATRLKQSEKGIVIVIDPNHDLAVDLSKFADYYYDASIPNFAVNPLQLAHVFAERDDNISYTVNNALSILEKMMNLGETAVNVRYIFQTLLYALFKRKDNITFAELYRLALKLREDPESVTEVLKIRDKRFEEEAKALATVQGQSYVSLLSRLKPFYSSSILRKLTATTTLPLTEWKAGQLIVFDTGKNKLGEAASFLVQSTLLVKLYFYAISRPKDQRIPIFVLVDEFQNIADLEFVGEIFAEARKYGLHLIVAHQNAAQLAEKTREVVWANTNVKFIMAQSDPSSVSLTSRLEPDFDIKGILSTLRVGEALTFVRGIAVPILVKIDEFTDKGTEEIARQKARLAQTTTTSDAETVLADYYIKQNPVSQKVLYLLYTAPGRQLTFAQLTKAMQMPENKLLSVLKKMERKGFIKMGKAETGKVVVWYKKGLFKTKDVVKSREGKEIAKQMYLHYLSEGCTVHKGNQQGSIKPDYIVVCGGKVIAVEVESPAELRRHPEKVADNIEKYANIKEIAEIHVWTEDSLVDKVPKFSDSRVKVFSVKIEEQIQTTKQAEQTQKVEQADDTVVLGGVIVSRSSVIDKQKLDEALAMQSIGLIAKVEHRGDRIIVTLVNNKQIVIKLSK